MDDIEIVCTTCGERNPARNEFCFNCGSFLAWETRTDGPNARTQPEPASGTEREPGPAGPAHDKATRDQSRAPDVYGIYGESGFDDPRLFDTPETSTAAGKSPGEPAKEGSREQAIGPDGEPRGVDARTVPQQPADERAAEPEATAVLPISDPAYPEPADPDLAYPDPADPELAIPQSAEFACPACGVANPDTRRYCIHCGTSFYPEWNSSAASGPSWSPEAVAAHDRESERAYRRSLPMLYRWRRGLIGVVVLTLCVGLGFVIARGPVALAEDGWHQVADDYVTVDGVSVKVVPKNATAPGSNPQALIDGTAQEWTMIWRPAGTAACGAAPGTGVVEFSFPATRVRRIVIAPGLAADNPNGVTQPRPKAVGISFGGGPCQTLNLDNKPDQQGFRVDSGQPVQTLSLGISEAYPGDANQISLTEVWIQTFPS